MILKVQSHDDGWAYFDGIETLHVKHVEYTKAKNYEPKEGEDPSPCVFIISEGEEITREFVPSEIHGCIVQGCHYPAITINEDKDNHKCIVIGEGYLLNDQGKTIDKFEPYGEMVKPLIEVE